MTLMLAIIGGVCIFTGVIFFVSKNKRQKVGAAITFTFFVILGIMSVSKNNFMKNAIENGEWEVRKDNVDRVMQETDSDGDVSYFMVLEEYGRVSLESYSEASQYHEGDKVYVVIVPKGNSFERTGIAYHCGKYYYSGSH